MFAKFMALGSLLMVIVSLPISLFFVVKVVQVRTSDSRRISDYSNENRGITN